MKENRYLDYPYLCKPDIEEENIKSEDNINNKNR